MDTKIQKKIFTIEGMTCVNCENKIEQKLKETKGIQSVTVSYNKGSATVTFYEEQIKEEEIIEIVEALGYQVLQKDVRGNIKKGNESSEKKDTILQIVGTLVFMIALSILLKLFGVSTIFNQFPQVEETMGYGMLFFIGLLTSVHCIGMCGGIHLSQCLSYERKESSIDGQKQHKSRWAVFYPSFLYNAGRVLSYTVIGGIVGGLGSVVSFSGAGKGLIQLIAGVFMVIMGLNMLHIFPWLRKLNPRMPKFFALKINQKKRNTGPFYIGILNGLMPCGPLQAMQLYALSTESPIKGAFSMFLFSIGTVPLMFGFGALSSLLSQKFTKKVMKVGAVFVVVLGISMFQNGWSLSGFPVLSLGVTNNKTRKESTIKDGVQEIQTTLSPYGYEAITVQKGIPVKWTITAENGSLNGCNNAIIIPEYDIQQVLQVGENVIEFTPTEAGTYPYSCWMGMIRSSITVLEEGQKAPEDNGQQAQGNINNGFGMQKKGLANYRIPTDKIAIGKIEDGVQKVEISLGKNRFTPAVIVLQEGVETEWIINTKEVTKGRESLLFPAYQTAIPLEEGENKIYLEAYGDFDFLTEDNKIFGYVKVVDDLKKVDLDVVRDEVIEHVTYVWEYEGGE